METKIYIKNPLKLLLVLIWILNCTLGSIIALHEIWIPKLDAAGLGYKNIKSEPFDGTSLPITHIPNWYKIHKTRSLKFQDIPMNSLIPIPLYDINALQNPKNTIMRLTYTVPYMGSYEYTYKEYEGSHLGIDISAPTGTPVLSIANGVVVRAVNGDISGNRFVVIRHDNVPYNGKITTLYSAYLHLSEITTTEGTKIRKGEMLGRVGMTGFATGPHLHFQIDTADAPFHPYWPFSFSSVRAKGLSVFQATNLGVGKENALKYSIHPLEFAQKYLNGFSVSKSEPKKEIKPTHSLEDTVSFKKEEVQNVPQLKPLEEIANYTHEGEKEVFVASKIVYNNKCQKLNGVDINTAFGMLVANLHNEKCIFDYIYEIKPEAQLTRSQAIIMLMKFNEQDPIPGISHFLDIPLSNEILQGYALRGYQNNILRGNYLNPNRVITKGEFIEFLSRFGKLATASKNAIFITDISPKSTLFQSVQNYGYTINAKNMKFSPNSALTQEDAIEILQNLKK